MDDALKETTRKTARMLFHSIKSGVGFDTWKKFDKDLARELSMFFTGKLYSREVISQKQRELCAIDELWVSTKCGTRWGKGSAMRSAWRSRCSSMPRSSGSCWSRRRCA